MNQTIDHFIPENDALRLEKLRDYNILDTHPEDVFDIIASMAQKLFGTSGAFINFVDKDRVFFKSNLSALAATEIPRKDSLCSRAILQDDVYVLNDTHNYAELVDNPYIAQKGGIRFYAGATLKTPEGYNMGTICVTDDKPGEVTEQQVEMLRTLSKMVIDKLENRLRYRRSIEAQVNLMNITLHDIKNPLASINLANDMLRGDTNDNARMNEVIKTSVKSIEKRLSELLKQSELEETDLLLKIEEIDINEILTRLYNNFDLLARRKKQFIELKYNDSLPRIDADKGKISDVLHNLVSNAIKYSYPDSKIKIEAREAGYNLHIEVRDEGQGLDRNDVQKLFMKFAHLSSKPTGKETSTGLGLSIAKSFVELHKGTIYAMSPGKDKGTTFIVSLPIRYIPEREPDFEVK
ncbi:GAF domain-containing sensor histidine kinase [Flavobacterium sp.]|uniref:GAF domain-containing sensor histidine kinase n=1 Tax=Flavobacterium sp. TaxID=239 RepID=UPI0040331C76